MHAQVDGRVLDLTQNAVRHLQWGGNNAFHLVQLELEPRGACVVIDDDKELRSLVVSLLSTLRLLHAAGYVHRDIKHSNVRL